MRGLRSYNPKTNSKDLPKETSFINFGNDIAMTSINAEKWVKYTRREVKD